MDFNPPSYTEAEDGERIRRQRDRVLAVMSLGEWRTLQQISMLTGAPEASASARLRDLRKLGWIVQRERVEGAAGLWKYRAVRA
jgi:predicted transcriptional regulator